MFIILKIENNKLILIFITSTILIMYVTIIIWLINTTNITILIINLKLLLNQKWIRIKIDLLFPFKVVSLKKYSISNLKIPN